MIIQSPGMDRAAPVPVWRLARSPVSRIIDNQRGAEHRSRLSRHTAPHHRCHTGGEGPQHSAFVPKCWFFSLCVCVCCIFLTIPVPIVNRIGAVRKKPRHDALPYLLGIRGRTCAQKSVTHLSPSRPSPPPPTSRSTDTHQMTSQF